VKSHDKRSSETSQQGEEDYSTSGGNEGDNLRKTGAQSHQQMSSQGEQNGQSNIGSELGEMGNGPRAPEIVIDEAPDYYEDEMEEDGVTELNADV
jgi:hypothetical protein